MNLARMIPDEPQSSDSDNHGIRIKCYSNIGEISGWGKVSLDAREVINLDAQVVLHLVVIEIETGGDYPQHGSAILTYDQISKICSAIDKIKMVDPKGTKFSNIEAEFTIEDFGLTVFNAQRGKMMVAIRASGAAVHFDLPKIDELKNLLLKAKNTIDLCKSPNT